MNRVLVANRGEIAVRIMRTVAAMGLESVAVYTAADAGTRHVFSADQAVAIDSYLDVEAIVAAARTSGADAVHPGYGFLSENPALPNACAANGITWIGPPPDAIETMGDKINAKAAVAAAGVPIVPGRGQAGWTDEQVVAAALEIGLPVLLKPSAGGGGKGMRRVEQAGDLAAEVASARREARGAFGDDTLLVERWVSRPRHIEVQVFADTHGRAIHLGERECSLQRRHQKIIEEAPSPLLDEATRAAMGASAVAAARACGYVGAGTVEFIVSASRPDEYFFMEMNTRLQVEHPVTEAVTGLDLVEWQIRVARDEPLPQEQADIHLDGHAFEARVYAEDPDRGFLPASGPVLAVHEPTGPHIRVDSGLQAGTEVGTAYDPMLAKVIAWGHDREQARARLEWALGHTAVLGLTTNVAFLQRLVGHPDVVSATIDTELVERNLAGLRAPVPGPEIVGAAALTMLWGGRPAAVGDPWDQPGGWRPGTPAAAPVRLRIDGEDHQVDVIGPPTSCLVVVDGAEPVRAAFEAAAGQVIVTWDGRRSAYWWATDGRGGLWLSQAGAAWEAHLAGPTAAGSVDTAAGAGPLVSPMPGTVLSVLVSAGDWVEPGQVVANVEAMKMEYAVRAGVAGTVTDVRVRSGQAVARDQVLAVVTPDEVATKER